MIGDPRTEFVREVKSRWGDRYHETKGRGKVYVPPVREGGLTEALINLAADVAMAYADRAYDEGFENGYATGEVEGHSTGYFEGRLETDRD